jgi:glucan-binding YG repeat protein
MDSKENNIDGYLGAPAIGGGTSASRNSKAGTSRGKIARMALASLMSGAVIAGNVLPAAAIAGVQEQVVAEAGNVSLDVQGSADVSVAGTISTGAGVGSQAKDAATMKGTTIGNTASGIANVADAAGNGLAGNDADGVSDGNGGAIGSSAYDGLSGWQEGKDGKIRMLDEDGNPLSGIVWSPWDGAYYFLGDDGSIMDWWKDIDGSWHFFENSGRTEAVVGDDGAISNDYGKMIRGASKEISGKEYLFDADGAMVDGWRKDDDGNWLYYMPGDGFKATGWQKIGGRWYWFADDGIMRTGWQFIGDSWYYFDESEGTGWLGIMRTGWIKDAGKWWYLNQNGAMRRGWLNDGGSWYYMDPHMRTGWQMIGGTWYWFDGSGRMKTGWLYLPEGHYYFGSDGRMYADEYSDDGYWLLSDGRWDGQDNARERWIRKYAYAIDCFNAGWPIEGYGRVFAESAWDAGISPTVAAAIARVESGSFRTLFHSNGFGWSAYLGSDWETVIRNYSFAFSNGYGYDITYSGALRYAANGQEGYWLSLVNQQQAIIESYAAQYAG